METDNPQILKFSLDTIGALNVAFAQRGWEVNTGGLASANIKAESIINGTAHKVKFAMGLEPSMELVTATLHDRMPNPPVVLSRVTPDEQRESHLQRPIFNGERQMLGTFTDVITQRVLDNPQIDANFDIATMPIMDCVVGMPAVADTIYFAGSVQIEERNGLAITIDKGVYNPVHLLSIDPYKISFKKRNMIPLVGLADAEAGQAPEAQIFNVVDAIPDEQLNIHALRANSVSVLVVVSDRQNSQILPAFSEQGFGFDVPTRSANTFGGGFGRMGENAGTGTYGQFAKADSSYRYPLLINIYPYLLPAGLSSGDNSIAMLAESLS